MKLSANEIALIAILRTLDFCDMLDVFDSLEELSHQAKQKGIVQAHQGTNPVSAAGWMERAVKVEKLRDALCMANDDYRDHVFPESEPKPEVLQ